MSHFIKKLRLLLTKRDKKLLLILFIFSIFVSLIEMIGISAIMPFISAASNFDIIHKNEKFRAIYEYFNFNSEVNFILVFAAVLVIFYLLRSLINILYTYAISRFSFGRYHQIAYRLFENYLGREYREYIKKNSSELTKTIVNEADNLTKIISYMLIMVSEIFVIILIYSMLLYVNWQITMLLTIFLAINSLFLVKSLSKKIKKEGKKREKYQKFFYEILNSTFGNFKLIKLSGNENSIKENFAVSSAEYSKTNIVSATITAIPRLFLEALSFSIVVMIIAILIYTNQSDISKMLPIVSVFILGLYRLMPSLNRIIANYNNIMFNHRALEIVHNDLIYEVEDLKNESVAFSDSIHLNNISFNYEDGKDILRDINITIKKGDSIAIVGESGSGKSTLVDIIIGLFKPLDGYIEVDNKKLDTSNIKGWRKKIGYIPQFTYLFDGSVGANVAFEEKFDAKKVKECLRQAKLLNFLEEQHSGLDTQVGEDGIMLSGGQKQRVAIARALYRDPEILVLDEATSALDMQTEAAIMDEIYSIGRDKTLIIIAHRLSTVERCNKVYRIIEGRVDKEG